MKHSLYIILLVCCSALFSCRKTIDLYPQSNLNTGTYYSNLEELKAGLTGAYNGLQRSLFNEWQLTELRSDNAKQGQPGSTASTNRDLSDLDMFIPSTSHQGIYNYWANTYNKFDPSSPFGGYKESGFGREGGLHGLAAYVRL